MNVHPRRLLAMALTVPLGLTAFALTAPAAFADETLPSFSYADCPDALPVGADPNSWICDIIVIPAGSMKIGGITQPITQPMTMTVISGLDPKTGNNRNVFIKMRAKPMTVAGGALGIPGSDTSLPILKLQVQPKYAGNFSLGFDDTGTIKSTIDLRFKIINQLMGDKCFIGTAKAPVKLNLVADMSTFQWYDTAMAVTVNDNAFAAPATSGCGVLAPIANLRSGLPSASGKNSASFRMFLATKPYSELFPTMKGLTKKKRSTAVRLPLGLPSSLAKRH